MKSTTSATCPLCDEKLTDSGEHIFPWAIGGRKVVRGFICQKCNSDTGAKWDTPLCAALSGVGFELGIKRQAGQGRRVNLPPQEYELQDGTKIKKYADGTIEPVLVRKPREVTKHNGKEMHKYSYSGTEGDVRKEFAARKKEYEKKERRGKISGLEIGEPVFHETIREINEAVLIESVLGGDEATSRSIVKTALAAAFDAGVDVRKCDTALRFLKGDSAVECYFPAAFPNFDMEWHWVAVRTNLATSQLRAVVLYFGAVSFHILLSDGYRGPELAYEHKVDPKNGVILS